MKKVSFDAQHDDIAVEYVPGNVSHDALIAAVAKAGYKARVRDQAAEGGAAPSTSLATTAATASRAVWTAARVPEPVRSALAQAKRDRKPVLLDFSATWCGPCKRLARETLAAPAIAKALEGFVVLTIDADKDAEATNFFEVKALPQVRLLLFDGTEARRIDNFVTANELAPLLAGVVAENADRARKIPSSPEDHQREKK